jgi:hypothetical protein
MNSLRKGEGALYQTPHAVVSCNSTYDQTTSATTNTFHKICKCVLTPQTLQTNTDKEAIVDSYGHMEEDQWGI